MISPAVVTAFMKDIANAEKDNSEEVLGDDESPTDASDATVPESLNDENETIFFDKPDSSKRFIEFKAMIESNDLDDISQAH